MPDAFYLSFGLDLAESLAKEPLAVMLAGGKYVPDVRHRLRSDVADEITGDGYTSGGKALTGVTVRFGVDGSVTLDADDVAWDATLSARYAVVYKIATGSLVRLVDFGSVQTRENFRVAWNKTGILGMTLGA
jgi:hypothetical protein